MTIIRILQSIRSICPRYRVEFKSRFFLNAHIGHLSLRGVRQIQMMMICRSRSMILGLTACVARDRCYELWISPSGPLRRRSCLLHVYMNAEKSALQLICSIIFINN